MTNFIIYFFLHFFLLIIFLNTLNSTPIELSHRKWKKILDLRNFDFLQKFLCPGLMILRKMTNSIISTFLHFFSLIIFLNVQASSQIMVNHRKRKKYLI